MVKALEWLIRVQSIYIYLYIYINCIYICMLTDQLIEIDADFIQFQWLR